MYLFADLKNPLTSIVPVYVSKGRAVGPPEGPGVNLQISVSLNLQTKQGSTYYKFWKHGLSV
jgi:hypothetical protein